MKIKRNETNTHKRKTHTKWYHLYDTQFRSISGCSDQMFKKQNKIDRQRNRILNEMAKTQMKH